MANPLEDIEMCVDAADDSLGNALKTETATIKLYLAFWRSSLQVKKPKRDTQKKRMESVLETHDCARHKFFTQPLTCIDCLNSRRKVLAFEKID